MDTVKNRGVPGYPVGVLVLLLVAGCRSDKVDINRAAEQARQSTERAGNEVATKTRPLMQNARQQARQEANKAGKALGEGEVTLKVKAALMASDRLNTSAIDVDTRDHVVYLKGSVPQASQKTVAETIAKNTVAPGVKVVNQLQVQPARQQQPP